VLHVPTAATSSLRLAGGGDLLGACGLGRAGGPALRRPAAAPDSSHELERIREAGYDVLIRARAKPDLIRIRRELERGRRVRFEADEVSVYQLERLAKLPGTAVAVFRQKHSAYHLQRVCEAGVLVEICSAHYSVYELERIADD
jgi:hypothetical protein